MGYVQMETITNTKSWTRNGINRQQITKYLNDGNCFIDTAKIESQLLTNGNPDSALVKDILQKYPLPMLNQDSRLSIGKGYFAEISGY